MQNEFIMQPITINASGNRVILLQGEKFFLTFTIIDLQCRSQAWINGKDWVRKGIQCKIITKSTRGNPERELSNFFFTFVSSTCGKNYFWASVRHVINLCSAAMRCNSQK